MRRVRIEPVTKTRFRIYLDGQFAFVLYKSELVSCKVKDGEEISDEQVEVILKGIILKRAKQKALSLLQSMDRTKSELRERLLRQDFPEKIADEAVRYVESFGYYLYNFVLLQESAFFLFVILRLQRFYLLSLFSTPL